MVKNSNRKSVLSNSFNLNNVSSRCLFYESKVKFTCFRQTAVRAYSTSRKDGSSSTDSFGLTVFSDADKDKLDILKFIKGKAGIYMWNNKLNGKKYVGGSVDVRRRLLEYYNVNRLINEESMPICAALLKHGYQNFSLTVLEICDVDSLMSREKHFFEVYSPEYNILKIPGSPSRGSGWKHSEATIENMRAAANIRCQSPENLAKMSAAQSNSIKVEVTDLETNTSTTYHAIRTAARALCIDRRYIEHYIYLNQAKPVLGRYIFKLHSDSGESPKLVSVERVKKSLKLEVTNVDTKKVIIYPSIGAAARALGCYQASISLYLKENRTKPFKGMFLFKFV